MNNDYVPPAWSKVPPEIWMDIFADPALSLWELAAFSQALNRVPRLSVLKAIITCEASARLTKLFSSPKGFLKYSLKSRNPVYPGQLWYCRCDRCRRATNRGVYSVPGKQLRNPPQVADIARDEIKVHCSDFSYHPGFLTVTPNEHEETTEILYENHYYNQNFCEMYGDPVQITTAKFCVCGPSKDGTLSLIYGRRGVPLDTRGMKYTARQSFVDRVQGRTVVGSLDLMKMQFKHKASGKVIKLPKDWREFVGDKLNLQVDFERGFHKRTRTVSFWLKDVRASINVAGHLVYVEPKEEVIPLRYNPFEFEDEYED